MSRNKKTDYKFTKVNDADRIIAQKIYKLIMCNLHFMYLYAVTPPMLEFAALPDFEPIYKNENE